VSEYVSLFDLDGTLTDPKPGVTGCIRHALERLNAVYGLSLDIPEPDALEWVIGPPLAETFRLLAGPDHCAAGLAFYRERYGVTGLFENEVYPGIPLALAQLQAHGWTMFVATSKVRVYAERIVEHFGLSPFFKAVHGSEFDGTNAHKPDLLRHIIATEGIDPARAVMIGDRKHDAIGAKANGVQSIGAGWGYGSDAELREAGVWRILASPGEIADALEGADWRRDGAQSAADDR